MKKATRRNIYIGLGAVVIIGIASAIVFNYNNTFFAETSGLFSKTFALDLTPLSTLSPPISCTVTNNLYYYQGNTRILYSYVPYTQTTYELLKFQGAGSKIDGYDVEVTIKCGRIPSDIAAAGNYNALYLTGGQLKDTFDITGTINTGGHFNFARLDQTVYPLPNGSPLATQVRVDNQGIVPIYKKHFDATTIQSAFGTGDDQMALIANSILYNLEFHLVDKNGKDSGYTHKTPQWGNAVTMKVWVNNNQVKQPPTNVQAGSKVQTLKWVAPNYQCKGVPANTLCVDSSSNDITKRTIQFQALLPQYVANEGTPTVSVYYTDTTNGIMTKDAISIIGLKLDHSTTDGTNTGVFTGSYVVDPISNYGTWKLVLNSAVDQNGNPKRNDPSNIDFLFYQVIRSSSPTEIVCDSNSHLVTDSTGSHCIGNVVCDANSTPVVDASGTHCVGKPSQPPAPPSGGACGTPSNVCGTPQCPTGTPQCPSGGGGTQPPATCPAGQSSTLYGCFPDWIAKTNPIILGGGVVILLIFVAIIANAFRPKAG